MFSTEGVTVVERSSESKYLTYGVQLAMVINAEVSQLAKGKKVTFNMEGPEVSSAGFEPDPASKRGGKVGRVEFASFINDDVAGDQGLADFLGKISILATKLNLLDAVNAIKASTVEEYVELLVPIIRGKFAWWAITGREYVNRTTGKVGITLGVRRYGFIASEAEGEKHLRPFDKANKFDFKVDAVPSPDPVSKGSGSEDTPSPKEDDLPW